MSFFYGQALFCYWLTSNLFTLGYGLGKSPPLSLSHRVLRREIVLMWHIVYIMCAALRRPDVRKLLNLPDAVTSSSTGQPKPPSPMPFSFEQPKDQSVVGHEDPPMSSSEDPSVSSSESSSSVPERRISRSSVLNQRIRTLERQLKDQKKKKWGTLSFFSCSGCFAWKLAEIDEGIKGFEYWRQQSRHMDLTILYTFSLIAYITCMCYLTRSSSSLEQHATRDIRMLGNDTYFVQYG